ncbi:hypothetical protein DV735_g3428, partial [Chaetothyriales sp. CBS 134920]
MASSSARGLKAVASKSGSDVVILSSLRTAITRSNKGGFRDAYDHELLSHVLRATLAANPTLPRDKIEDVAVGVVLAELGGSKAARMAQLHAGFDARATALHTVNRACSSGLAAITSIANLIASRQISVGVAAGMESMTRNYASRAIPVSLWDGLRRSPDQDARDCIMPMGLTSENVATRYGVGRADQDAFAVESHRRASHAQRAGLFDAEIVPVEVRQTELPPKGADKDAAVLAQLKTATVVVDKDDGIRHDLAVDTLAKLKPAFAQDGASTAGNSSQWVATQTVGCKPDEMGVGPAVAIPKLLDFTGLSTDDVKVWEINEAFASQALYCIRKLGLENRLDDVNPRGGAIALGHPLGMTGVRQLTTLLPQLQPGEAGVVSMCIGTGMGMAALFVRE